MQVCASDGHGLAGQIKGWDKSGGRERGQLGCNRVQASVGRAGGLAALVAASGLGDEQVDGFGAVESAGVEMVEAVGGAVGHEDL